MSWKTTCGMVLCVAGSLTGTQARAQEPAPAAAPAPQPPKHEEGGSDHDLVVGHLGVGYFGVSQLPQGNIANGVFKNVPINAPVIGARYWFQRNLGIDAGLGIGYGGGSVETVNGNNTQSTDKQSNLGFAFHLGVPIAFAHGKHYTFLLVPETTLGFTNGTLKGVAPPNPPGGPTPADTNFSGFLFNIGARIGAEIHFGFIGVPQLALEGGVGLYFRRETFKAKQDPNSTSDGTNTFATSLQGDPWALFLNQISAIYYF